MKSFLAFILIASLISFKAHPQIPSTPDSLITFLKNQPRDTTYVQAQNEYAFMMIQESEFPRADSLISSMETISKRLDYGPGYCKILNLKGFREYARQNYQKALEFFQESKRVVEAYKLPKSYYQNALNNIGIVYNQLGDKKKGFEYAMLLIDFQEKNKLYPLKTSPYNQIADILTYSGKYSEALIYYQKSLKIETEYKNPVGMAIAENRIGNTYELLNDPGESLKHFHLGLKYAEQAKYKLLQTDLLTNLGRLYDDQKLPDKAEYYLRKSEKICREVGSPNSMKMVLTNLGDFYLGQKNYMQAEKCYLEAYDVAKSIKDPQALYSVNNYLAAFYEEIKDYKNAYKFKVEASVAKDSTYKLETEEITQKLLTEYETKEKEQQITLLNERNEKVSLQNKSIIIGGLLLLLLTVLIVFFLINRNKLKRLQESQHLRNKIASDIHDEIGSTLSSILLISGMAKNQKNGEKSNKMFSKIHSDSQHIVESVDEIIWSVNPVNDSLQGILVRLREYAMPLAESKNLIFNFNVEKEIESLILPMEIRRNLYLIVKEAINNLIKYSEAGEAELSFFKEKKMIHVTIRDKGKGFDVSAGSSRNGLKNMRIRAHEIGGKLEIGSEPGEGTGIHLSFPLT